MGRRAGGVNYPKDMPSLERATQTLLRNGWDVTESGCWEARGYRTKDNRVTWGFAKSPAEGGGQVRYRSGPVAYRHFHGPIPEGQVVRHKCDNPPCVNPDHIELGTQVQNIQDMFERGRSRSQLKTTCPAGHDTTSSENLMPWELARGHRRCATCRREQSARSARAYRARKRETVAA